MVFPAYNLLNSNVHPCCDGIDTPLLTPKCEPTADKGNDGTKVHLGETVRLYRVTSRGDGDCGGLNTVSPGCGTIRRKCGTVGMGNESLLLTTRGLPLAAFK